MSDSVARRRYAPEYAAAVSGTLRTHATQDATPSCAKSGCPLLTFSHGGGVDRSLYTAQYEELASHGYIVAAIAHTGSTHRVVFSDGRSATAQVPPPVPERPEWQSLSALRRDFARDEAAAEYRRKVLVIEAADIRFVLDQFARIAKSPTSPFA